MTVWCRDARSNIVFLGPLLISSSCWLILSCKVISADEQQLEQCCYCVVLQLVCVVSADSELWVTLVFVWRGDRQQMMEAAAQDANRQQPPGVAGSEDSRSGLIYNDDMGRADPFVGQKGPPPGEPQHWNYWTVSSTFPRYRSNTVWQVVHVHVYVCISVRHHKKLVTL